MVFGVFDGLHEGHREFLHHAKREGDYLIAVVTPDHVVHELKGHLPDAHLGDRMERLLGEGLADRVTEGDPEIRTWHVVRRHKPDIIALGYDQNELLHELEEFIGALGLPVEVRVMPAHKPTMHHSSLLRKKKTARR